LSPDHQIARFELEEMKKFKALVCTGYTQDRLSLPSYLEKHDLPADMRP
jgi:hypothetical protein